VRCKVNANIACESAFYLDATIKTRAAELLIFNWKSDRWRV